MKNFLVLSASTALLSGLILITGCSSDDSSSGGGGSAAVPANAILIDNSATAESTTISAVATGTSIVAAFGVETSTPLTAKDIINLALDKVQSNNQITQAIASGADLSHLCITGTATGNESETSTTYSASATFNSCEIGSGLFFTGAISINSSFSSAAGTYSNTASGNLTVVTTNGSNTITIGFNGFSYAESGNENTGAYTINTFTYAIAPSTGGGYAVQLTQPLVGNKNSSCELSSGQVLITGAAGSQARGTVNPDGTVKIEYHNGNGTFVETGNSPLACLV